MRLSWIVDLGSDGWIEIQLATSSREMSLNWVGATMNYCLLSAGQLIYALLVLPLMWFAIWDFPLEFFWGVEHIAMDILFTAVDAALIGAALWWACDWHLGRQGLHLTQQGSIVPRAAAASHPA